MSVKPMDMYQGSDWFTYRWSVAQAFDTLDRIRDLCLQMPVAKSSDELSESDANFKVPDEEIADMFGYIVELCDDLSGEIDMVQADVSPGLRGQMAQLWSAFEIRLHLNHLRDAALHEAAASEPSHAPPDAILAFAGHIRNLLKQVDQ